MARRRKPPQREIVETGSERHRQIIDGYIRQELRLRRGGAEVDAMLRRLQRPARRTLA